MPCFGESIRSLESNLSSAVLGLRRISLPLEETPGETGGRERLPSLIDRRCRYSFDGEVGLTYSSVRRLCGLSGNMTPRSPRVSLIFATEALSRMVPEPDSPEFLARG